MAYDDKVSLFRPTCQKHSKYKENFAWSNAYNDKPKECQEST